MRRFFASIMLTIVIGLSLGVATAHAEGKTITVEQGLYIYSCTTEVQAKETMQIKIDDVQYSCYTAEHRSAENQDWGILILLIPIVGFIYVIWFNHSNV